MHFMTRSIFLFAVASGFGGLAAAQSSEFAAGRAYYQEGQFKKAAAQFQLAVQTNPSDAESYRWLGISYQTLGDIATPFGARYYARARVSLAKAVALAPGRADYRRDLFEALTGAAESSPSALRQAAELLYTVPVDDPDYFPMRRRLEREIRTNRSASAVLGRLFLAAPRTLYGIGESPAPVCTLSSLK
jgi:tetratricopeptide (TPR) repeat protein